jgi:hypothetical protein
LGGDLLAALFVQDLCPGSSAFLTAAPAALDSGRIFPILDPILNLARRDIDDELRQLSGITRARETLGCHELFLQRGHNPNCSIEQRRSPFRLVFILQLVGENVSTIA